MTQEQTGEDERSFGWALIGIGGHIKRFIAPAMAKSPISKLVAVTSRDFEKAKSFAKEFGDSATTVHEDLDAMLEDKAISAVFVGSPNNIHKEQILKIARAGKHVLCEKPLSNNAKDSLDIVRACKDAHVKLGVGYNQRHNPVHEEARSIVSQGQIGDVLFSEVEYMSLSRSRAGARQAWRDDVKAAGGGDFMGSGVHCIDLLRFALGKEVDAIFAKIGVADSLGVDRLTHATLQMSDGKCATLSSGSIVPYPLNNLTIYGTKGTLRCTGSISNSGGGEIHLTTEAGSKTMNFERCDAYLREIDAFVKAISKGEEPNASGVDGLRTDEITERLYESARSGKMVQLVRAD